MTPDPGPTVTDETEAREALAVLLDEEGYGSWIDTDQLVGTLREHRHLVAKAVGFQQATGLVRLADGRQLRPGEPLYRVNPRPPGEPT